MKEISQAIFGETTQNPEDWEKKYPPRPAGQIVTRIAPSPTGFLHIGNLFGAMADRMAAKDGVFYLRLEDTDKKREVPNGLKEILDGFQCLEINFDEGVFGEGEERGDYGPYTQSRRKLIYHTYARKLLEEGLAYPCFCGAQDLDELRGEQERAGVNKGYYGAWARCRDLSPEERLRRIRAGEAYTLRLRSPGDESKKIIVEDIARGKLEFPENTMDIVLLKADGMPTYHFAHAVDDHLMRTTHVIRGDEWLASLPLHIQLFTLLGFRPPKYAHHATVMKIDDGGKRKLSKRKDPEAAVRWFVEQGYPAQAVQAYLLTLLNSNFEDWRRANPHAQLREFPFSLKKMSPSGALFDLAKLEDVSKNAIAGMRAEDVYTQALAWAKEFDPAFAALLEADEAYAVSVFSIDRGNRKPRKDIARWSQVRGLFVYFYDILYMPLAPDHPDARAILEAYLETYRPEDDKDAWFARIKGICEPLGYAPEVKLYNLNPSHLKGHVGDVSGVIRFALTSRTNTPDLWAIMRVLGETRAKNRIRAALAALK